MGFIVGIRLALRLGIQRIHALLSLGQVLGGNLLLGFCRRQLDPVLCRFQLHFGVALIQAVHFLLDGLLQCIPPPRLGVGFQGSGPTLDGIGLQVNQARQLRHRLAKQGQGTVVLPLLVLGFQARGLQLFQALDVPIRHIRRRLGGGNGFIISGAYIRHGAVHFPRRLGQLFQGRPGPLGHRGDPRNGSHHGGNRRRDAKEDVDARNGSGEKLHQWDHGFCHRRISGQPSGGQADGTHKYRDRLDQSRVFLRKTVQRGEYIRSDAVKPPHFRDELFPNGGFKGIKGGFHQGQLAVHVVQLDGSHFLSCPAALVDAGRQGRIIFVGGPQDGQQAVVAPGPGQGHGVVDPLCLGHLREYAAQFVDGRPEVLHGPVRLDGGICIFPKGRAGEGRTFQQAVEDIPQSGSGNAALDARVGHEARCNGHVLYAVSQSTGNSGGGLERLTHNADAGVGVGSRCRKHVGKTGGVCGGQAKGREVVRHDIGHHG